MLKKSMESPIVKGKKHKNINEDEHQENSLTIEH